MQSYWDLNMLGNCMLMMMTLQVCMLHVRRQRLVNSIDKMGTCLEKVDFVCLVVLCVSCLCVKHIEVV